MDPGLLDLFEAELRRVVPELRVKFKDETPFQRFLGVLASPFNATYLTTSTTTFGNTVYFPSRAHYTAKPLSSLSVLAHEFVHIYDSQKDRLFQVKYAFPQALTVLPMMVYALLAGRHAWIALLPLVGYIVGVLLAKKSEFLLVLAFTLGVTSMAFFGWVFTGWKILVMLSSFGFLGPWASSWRTGYELRGYGMAIAVVQWVTGKQDKKYQDSIANQFTGSRYLYMCRDRAYIERTLEATRQQAEIGALENVSPYSIVYSFLYAHQLLYRKPA
jgi:hypothetical protein